MKHNLLVSLLILFFSWSASAQVCDRFPEPLTGGYCIYPGTSPDILYYFHGLNGSEKRWEETNFYTEQVRRYWTQNKQAQPSVIAVSFGPLWLFTPDLLHFFEAQIVPTLEGAIGGLKGRRLVVGESMGGFNSLSAALRTGLFAKGAFLCAPLADGLNPWSKKSETNKYVRSSTAYSVLGKKAFKKLKARVNFVMKSARKAFPTPEIWATVDPLALATAATPQLHSLKMYVSAGFYDEYVLYEGNAKFVSLLRERGLSVEWHPMWGGHCAIDVASLADFLVK